MQELPRNSLEAYVILFIGEIRPFNQHDSVREGTWGSGSEKSGCVDFAHIKKQACYYDCFAKYTIENQLLIACVLSQPFSIPACIHVHL